MGNQYRKNLPPGGSRHQKERVIYFDDRRPEQRPAFGIRRSLSRSTTHAILGVARELQQVGEITSAIDLRRSAHVTLLSKRALDEELRKGNGRGHSVGAMAVALEKRAKGRFAQHAPGVITGVGFIEGRVLGMWVESPHLISEREEIGEVLRWYGIPGIGRDVRDSRLHVSLGESQDILPLDVRESTEQALKMQMGVLPVLENELSFGRATVYSGEQQAA